MSTVLSFVDQLLADSGGEVEWSPQRDRIEALVPEEFQKQWKLPDPLVCLREGMSDGDSAACLPIGFGSELFERVMASALEQGRTAAVRLVASAPKRDVSAELERRFDALNATYRVESVSEGVGDYWLWSFSAVAEADERSERQCHVCISSNRVECPEVGELIRLEAAHWQPVKAGANEHRAEDLERIYVAASLRIARRLPQELTEFTQAITRRHTRDIRRIKEYFGELRREMEEEIERRGLMGEALQIRREKQGQLSGEEARKLAGLEEKYRLRINLRPWALMLARLPVKYCEINVKRRTREQRLRLVYNLLSKKFEPLACEACGADTFQMGFCDERMHLLCAACLDKSRGKGSKDCPRCQGKMGPKKLEQVEGVLQIGARRAHAS